MRTLEKSVGPFIERDLYPEVEPRLSGRLRASNLHELYYEESGSEAGYPALFLHGGPGGASSPKQRRFFDPAFYRIILFDQRGCGRSTPHAELRENTTWNLVEDIEKLRRRLSIDRWLIVGGSWGSTLALAYAITYPHNVAGLILRGVFLLRMSEISWFYQDGANHIFPDAWEDFAEVIPQEERSDMLGAYYRRLISKSEEVRASAARAWTRWEKSTSYLVPRLDEIERSEEPDYSLAFARLEAHYFVNRGFFAHDRYILDAVKDVRNIPTAIVQGRYDLVCPMRTAWDLHKAWPEAKLRIVPQAGHSAFDSGVQSELVAAIDAFREGCGFETL